MPIKPNDIMKQALKICQDHGYNDLQQCVKGVKKDKALAGEIKKLIEKDIKEFISNDKTIYNEQIFIMNPKFKSIIKPVGTYLEIKEVTRGMPAEAVEYFKQLEAGITALVPMCDAPEPTMTPIE